MKTRYFVIVGMLMLLLMTTIGNTTSQIEKTESETGTGVVAELTPHGQLWITDEAGFEAWPGEGTAEEPYVISGINITLDDQCVSISNTESYFVLRDSYIHYTGTENVPAVWFVNANNSRIEYCTIIGLRFGIHQQSSHNSNITHNILYGAISTYSPEVLVAHNTITMIENSSAYGIRILWGAHGARVFNNTIIGHIEHDWGLGIEVLESHNVMVYENSISGCSSSAIQFQESHYANITGNTLVENRIGIVAGTLAVLENNVVKGGAFGINVIGNNISVVGNSVYQNNYSGVAVSGYNCTFYGNFLGFNQEGVQGMEVDAANYWDDGISVGNYWSDYDGEGTYAVSGNQGGIDHYPKVFVESVIDHPTDLVVEVGTSENVSWSSNGTLPESYELTRDGELVDSDSWDGSVLSFELVDLEVGEYEFELTTHFGSRMDVSDSVMVTVQGASGPSIVLEQVSGIADEVVEVSAEVTDISGVLEVVLSYSVDNSTWVNVTMSEFGEEWNCSIPGQSVDSEVVYRVYAWDTLGNLGVSDTKSYLTQAGEAPPPPMTILLIAGAGVAVVLVVAVVVMKRR